MRSLQLLSAMVVLAAAAGCSGSSYMSGGGCTSGTLNGTGSGTKSSGTFTQAFATPGTYTYQCAVHGAAMGGTVTVN